MDVHPPQNGAIGHAPWPSEPGHEVSSAQGSFAVQRGKNQLRALDPWGIWSKHRIGFDKHPSQNPFFHGFRSFPFARRMARSSPLIRRQRLVAKQVEIQVWGVDPSVKFAQAPEMGVSPKWRTPWRVLKASQKETNHKQRSTHFRNTQMNTCQTQLTLWLVRFPIVLGEPWIIISRQPKAIGVLLRIKRGK